MLRCAEVIYLLKGWESSPGARAEKALAEKLELQVIYQKRIEQHDANQTDHKVAMSAFFIAGVHLQPN